MTWNETTIMCKKRKNRSLPFPNLLILIFYKPTLPLECVISNLKNIILKNSVIHTASQKKQYVLTNFEDLCSFQH